MSLASAPLSGGASRPRVTTTTIQEKKMRREPITCLTAYDYWSARLVDEAGIDMILVGDSLAMVVLGYENTLPVTVEEMLHHTRAAARGTKSALLIADMPYASYHISPKEALRNAARFVKEAGAAAVKLEGGVHQAGTIEALSAVDLPVMAHVGMRPQSVRKYGRMSAIQRDEERLVADALSAQQAGAFAIVLELIPRGIAKRITAELSIPTIGIGAGPDCDGQVLVSADMLGLTTEFNPRYLKKYADLHTIATRAVQEYVREVREGRYPDAEHSHE